MSGPVCIECGSTASLVGGERIYPHRPDLYARQFYLCECGAYCGTHKGTKRALGYPCGPQTRRARSAAHAAFDPLWRGKSAQFRRKEAYAWLSGEMGLSREDCHIGMMNAEQAQRVVRLCQERKHALSPASGSTQALIGRTKRTSKWKGEPTPEGCPPWEV